MIYAFYSLLTFFLVLCVLFIGLILVQKGRGGGISSAFGGAGGNTAFGSKTGDVLTWATSVVFAIFLICCVGLSLVAAKVNDQATGKVVAPPTASNTGLPLAVPTTEPAADSETPQAATLPAGEPVGDRSLPTTMPASQPDWVPNKIPVGQPAP